MKNKAKHVKAICMSLSRRETWMLGWSSLRNNATRAILTALGITTGSACIVLVVSIALTGKRYVLAQIEGVGVNIVYAGLQHGGGIESPADEISLADLRAVEQAVPGVSRAAGTHDMHMSIAVGGVEWPVSVVGVTPEFQAIRNLQVLEGRYFDPDEASRPMKVCLITQLLATTVCPESSCLDREIQVGEMSFTIIGVFRERVATFGQSEISDRSLIIPFPLIKYYTGQSYLRTLYVEADTSRDVPIVTKNVMRLLHERHSPEAKYTVQNLTGLLAAANRISLALMIVLILVALIVLAVSGVGIMNIMLVTVSERTHEIGIRRAVGARSDDVLAQFLAEALIISVVGSVVGVCLSSLVPAVADYVLKFFPDWAVFELPLSWTSVTMALMVSCLTGLVFGYWPARRAARLHPTESLRYE